MQHCVRRAAPLDCRRCIGTSPRSPKQATSTSFSVKTEKRCTGRAVRNTIITCSARAAEPRLRSLLNWSKPGHMTSRTHTVFQTCNTPSKSSASVALAAARPCRSADCARNTSRLPTRDSYDRNPATKCHRKRAPHRTPARAENCWCAAPRKIV